MEERNWDRYQQEGVSQKKIEIAKGLKNQLDTIIKKEGINLEPIDVTIRIPKSLYENIKKQAEERGISTASLVREALMKSIEISEKEENEIDELLKSCSSDKDSFTIEDEYGFLNRVSKSSLKGNIWTPEQLDKVANKFYIGWKGYFVQPDPKDLLARFSKAISPGL